jgi:hypothetical protein
MQHGFTIVYKSCLSKLVSIASMGLVLFCLSAMIIANQSHAEVAFSNQFALRYNPLGLQDELYFGYKKKLFKAAKNKLLFGKSYIWTGALVRATPQFAHFGGFIRTLPIAILELQASAVGVLGFSDSKSVQDKSYFTEATRQASAETGSIIDNGWIASLQARLQYKKDAIAIRSTHLFRHFAIDGDSSSGMFYDQNLDLVLPFDSWAYQTDTDVLYADDNKQWVLGLRHTYARSLSDAAEPSTTLAGQQSEVQLHEIHRAGPLLAWKFKQKTKAKSKKSKDPLKHALLVLSQWHIKHRLRTGDPTPGAVPYFAVAYVVSGTVFK